ncbi:hypothetical protein [Microbulbifer sp. TYP-18]|uniref:hypothetical protein n=1 Tax=Microbulbifer sp. TYP-18 TaxID=3230024 RepID=UPI0034C604F3
MRFLAVFLFLFSTAALASEVKLVCTISGKYFSREDTTEYKIIFDDSEKRACTDYPCKRSKTYKANEAITFPGYENWETTNTVETWSKEIIELNQRNKNTKTWTLDRISGRLRYVFENSGFEVRINMEGPCKVVKKFENEKPAKF